MYPCLSRLVSGAVALALALTLGACGGGEESEHTQSPLGEIVVSTPQPSPEPTPQPPTVSKLVVCGDAMSHSSNVEDSWDEEKQEYNYLREMGNVRPWIESADYAVANLETTLAADRYSGYPAFRTPDAMAYNLKDLGFDMLLTANNHCMDAGFSGVCRTLDVLDQVGIAHVGTSRTQAEADSDIVLADVGGISVAFLGYTYGTNGFPLSKDAPFSVNLFNKDYLTHLSELDEAHLRADLAKAKALEPDLVAVMIHWGVEYQTKPNKYQQRVADFLIENGADLILGGHPHVLQPVEEARTVTLPDGSQRTGFVAYSLGNFLSGQLTKNDAHVDATAILTITLERDNETGQSRVADWEYAPIYRTDDKSAPVRFVLLDPYTVPENALAQAELEFIHQILGPEHDSTLRAQALS